MIVIADTTPLNYLIRIGEVSILAHLYRKIVIPSAVQTELLDIGAPDTVRAWMASPPEWVDVHTADAIPSMFPSNLDIGEIEAIALAETLHADLLIVDDMLARREAERRGLHAVGTLGVLREASKAGLLDLRSALFRLRQTNFRISATVLSYLLS